MSLAEAQSYLDETRTPRHKSDGVFYTKILEVVIELELCWMWTQADVVNFLLTLPLNPC